jgi:hypothetical protein
VDSAPTFISLPNAEARELANATTRRDWTEVKTALRAGGKLFFPLDQLSPSGVKYLSLAFARKQLGKTLRVRKVQHDGVEGRLIWLDTTKKS